MRNLIIGYHVTSTIMFTPYTCTIDKNQFDLDNLRDIFVWLNILSGEEHWRFHKGEATAYTQNIWYFPKKYFVYDYGL